MTSASLWHSNAEAGPSTLRQRTGSWPARYPTPAQQVIAQTNASDRGTFQGQLTENISPPSSAPPSPIAHSFPRSRSDSGQHLATLRSLNQSRERVQLRDAQIQAPNAPFAQPYRPSSPLNPNAQVQPSSQVPTQTQPYPSQAQTLFSQAASPRRQSRSRSPPGSPRSIAGSSDVDELMLVPSAASVMSGDEEPGASLVGGGAWRLVGKTWGHGQVGNNGGSGGGFMALGSKRSKEKIKEKERLKMMRRRTTMDPTGELFLCKGPESLINPFPFRSITRRCSRHPTDPRKSFHFRVWAVRSWDPNCRGDGYHAQPHLTIAAKRSCTHRHGQGERYGCASDVDVDIKG